MNKQVNFEDNIFILLMRIKMIRDTITLDADPELFLEKILDDIYFTDHVLRILLEHLEENDRLIARDEFLDQLYETERQFSQVIDEVLNHKGNIFVRGIPEINDKLIFLRKSSLERRRIIETLYQDSNNSTDKIVVSSDELSELLKVFQ